MDKNYYSSYYYQYEPQKNNIIKRINSVEAVKRFRNEFGINKEDFCDEGLEKRLIENNLDIYKKFEKMFG